LVARFADEWNTPEISPQDFTRLNQQLDRLLQQVGRQPAEVRRSLMTNCTFGKDENEVRQKVAERTYARFTLEEFRQRGAIVGTANQIVDQLGVWAEAGIQRVMLQWLDLDDIDGLTGIATQVLPYFK
jgi:alkanesulfonate monooxygenase SsuD/methylene tetrahydromethanopterin reductase-like flavin-dependent oxidoreductase (luciferase family)